MSVGNPPGLGACTARGMVRRSETGNWMPAYPALVNSMGQQHESTAWVSSMGQQHGSIALTMAVMGVAAVAGDGGDGDGGGGSGR